MSYLEYYSKESGFPTESMTAEGIEAMKKKQKDLAKERGEEEPVVKPDDKPDDKPDAKPNAKPDGCQNNLNIN